MWEWFIIRLYIVYIITDVYKNSWLSNISRMPYCYDNNSGSNDLQDFREVIRLLYFTILDMSKDGVILLLVAIAFVGRCGAIGFHNSTNMLERRIGLMYEQVKELRQIDKQKCIDLFMD